MKKWNEEKNTGLKNAGDIQTATLSIGVIVSAKLILLDTLFFSKKDNVNMQINIKDKYFKIS
ncbi:hypothetical protein D0511_04545 [Pseudoalteromonas piscicida]|uniref:Uncharacterized protein n=1 Tax=Pseudoalteromonas piscicida TaxID=43662 RepID=A0AAD0W3D0_PSEO7|nr:hypothetical protein D0511_04545 [Pseudoalteromonas piscicida]